MYYIVYDGEEADTKSPEHAVEKTRWKDDVQQYFKEYQAKEYQCFCGKTLRLGSKSNHLRSLKHRIYVLEQLTKNKSAPAHAQE
jgi:hypothetical protein